MAASLEGTNEGQKRLVRLVALRKLKMRANGGGYSASVNQKRRIDLIRLNRGDTRSRRSPLPGTGRVNLKHRSGILRFHAIYAEGWRSAQIGGWL